MAKTGPESADFSRSLRWSVGVAAVAGLLAVFIFQHLDVARIFWEVSSPLNRFIINRSIRFLFNDIFATLLVLAVFGRRKYVVIAIVVQCLGIFVVLMPYMLLKVHAPGYNGPLISFLHRLVLNPVLIYILIFFFWAQEKRIFSTDNRD